MDEDTKAALEALKVEIEMLKVRLEPEDTSISLMQYARRIGYPRTSARRRMLAEKIGQWVGGRWRIKI